MNTSQAARGWFDIHQHAGELIGVPGAGGEPATKASDFRRRIAFMNRFGIAQAALMPAHSYAQPDGLSDTRAINNGLLAYAGLAPDRFPALVGTVEPRHGPCGVEEIRRVAGLGFKGLSWHHRMQGLPMDHPVMFAFLEEMGALGMVALIHCYANGDFEAPWRLRRLAEQFPGVRFVALDVMTSPENLEQLLAVLERLDNVWIDLTSTSLGAAGIVTSLRRVGAGRIVFGTNHYGTGTPDQLAELQAIEAAAPDAHERDLIMGDNARAILSLTTAR